MMCETPETSDPLWPFVRLNGHVSAKVWTAYKHSDSQPYVYKVVSREEATVHRRMKHAAVIPVEVRVVELRTLMFMPYVPTMHACLPYMPMAARLSALVNVAEALQHVHSKGYVHRDVKPENILYDQQMGKAFLTDFGYATKVGVETHPCYTPLYASPHALMRRLSCKYTPAYHDDVWSFGILVLECFIGAHAIYRECETEEQLRATQPQFQLSVASGNITTGFKPLDQLVRGTVCSPDYYWDWPRIIERLKTVCASATPTPATPSGSTE